MKLLKSLLHGSLLLAHCYLLTACFAPLDYDGGKGTRISIRIGGNTARSALTPEDLSFVVTVSGSGRQNFTETAKWGEAAFVPVAPGQWNVSAFAFGPDDSVEPAAISDTQTVTVYPRQITPVTIRMRWVAFDNEFTLNFDQITSGAPIINDTIVIFRSGTQTTYTITIADSNQYDLIEWYYGNTRLNDPASLTHQPSLTLDSSDIRYNVIGDHLLTLEVIKDGALYSNTITFEVR